MSAARAKVARPRGLVLVHGGLGGPGGGDDDWEAFCRRIGWQTGAAAPDASFEARIAEGLIAKAGAPDNVVELDVAREARLAEAGDLEPEFAEEMRRSFVRELRASLEEEPPVSGTREAGGAANEDLRTSGVHMAYRCEDAAQADFAADAEPERPRRRRRAGAAALTLALAAGVALAITRLAVFSGQAPAASIAAPSGEVARAITARPQVDAPPREMAPVRATPTEGPTAKPAPTTPRREIKAPRDGKPQPPGALVARRSDAAPEHPLAADRPAGAAREGDGVKEEGSSIEPGGAPEGDTRLAVASLDAPFASSPAAWSGAAAQPDPAASWGASVRSRIALSAADGVAPVKPSASSEVWSNGLPAADPARAERTGTGASWALSGARDRWMGASLTPAAPSLAQANIGVMVQVDLGKAIGNF